MALLVMVPKLSGRKLSRLIIILVTLCSGAIVYHSYRYKANYLGLNLYLFAFFALILSAIFWRRGVVRKVKIILPLSYLLVIFSVTIFACFSLDESQIQLIWTGPSYLIKPLEPLLISTLHNFTLFFNTIRHKNAPLINEVVIAPFIAFILIGVPFYCLSGKIIEIIWEKSLFPKSRIRLLLAMNAIFLVLSIYTIVENSQWRLVDFVNASVRGTLEAERDFHEGHLRVYILTPEKGRKEYFTGEKEDKLETWAKPRDYYEHIGIPYIITEKNFIRSYNRRMRNLTSNN